MNAHTLAELQTFSRYVLDLIVNPIPTSRRLPNISWLSLVIAQIGLALAASFLSGIIAWSILQTIATAFILPLSTLFVSYLISCILLLYFRLFLGQTHELFKFYKISAVSLIPYLLSYPFTPLLPPIILIGCAFAGIIMVVSLVENFPIDKTKAMQIVGTVIAIFFLFWTLNQILSHETPHQLPPPHAESDN